MHISMHTNSLDVENLVPTLALGLPLQSFASLLHESTSVILPMIGASDPPPADSIPASFRATRILWAPILVRSSTASRPTTLLTTASTTVSSVADPTPIAHP